MIKYFQDFFRAQFWYEQYEAQYRTYDCNDGASNCPLTKIFYRFCVGVKFADRAQKSHIVPPTNLRKIYSQNVSTNPKILRLERSSKTRRFLPFPSETKNFLRPNETPWCETRGRLWPITTRKLLNTKVSPIRFTREFLTILKFKFWPLKILNTN